MEKSKVKIHVTTPEGGTVSRTITNHKNIDDLYDQLKIFIKESHEAIDAGTVVAVTCSKCCNGISFKNCFRAKIKAGDVKASAV